MSLPHPISSSSGGQERSSAEGRDGGEEPGGPDPRDLEIGSPQTPTDRVRSQGKELDVT